VALAEEDRIQAEKLLKAYRQRLRYREEQIAQLGSTADPSIPIDRDFLEREIGMLEAVLKPDTSPAVAGLIKRRLEDDVFLFQQSVEQNARITKAEIQLQAVVVEQHGARQWRLDKGAVIDALQARAAREDTEAPAGRRRNFRLLLGNMALLIIIFASLIYLAGAR
jgi:hypothetical protein